MAYINLRKASNQSNEKIDITFDLEVLKIHAKKNIMVDIDLCGYIFTNIKLNVGEEIYWRNGDPSPLVVGVDGEVLEERKVGLNWQGANGKVLEERELGLNWQGAIPLEYRSFHTLDVGVWCSEPISR